MANALKRREVQLRRRGGESAFEKDAALVAEAIQLHKEGWSQQRIGQKLGVSQPVISRMPINRGFTTRAGGSRHGRWKGGRIETPGGYTSVWVDPSHFVAPMRTQSGYILEHRLVMAKYLDRPLLRRETAHHINGNRKDNRLENLQLRQGKHGKGSRFRCVDCGSHNVVPIKL